MADLRALETLVENRDAISVDTIHRICVRLASIANTIKVAGHPEREQLEALTKSLEEAANHAGFCGGEESFFGALELLAAKLPTPMQREAVEVA